MRIPRSIGLFATICVAKITSFSFHSINEALCRPISPSYTQNNEEISLPRRSAMIQGFLAILTPQMATAAMQNSQKVFTTGQSLGIEESKNRFREARKTIDYVIDNYKEIIQNGGGDNLRRYLGTVGTTSAICGIMKAMKELQGEAMDVVEYTENMSDFEYYLGAADTAAYSSMFVEFSSAKATPQQFYDEAAGHVRSMKVYIDKMASELEL